MRARLRHWDRHFRGEFGLHDATEMLQKSDALLGRVVLHVDGTYCRNVHISWTIAQGVLKEIFPSVTPGSADERMRSSRLSQRPQKGYSVTEALGPFAVLPLLLCGAISRRSLGGGPRTPDERERNGEHVRSRALSLTFLFSAFHFCRMPGFLVGPGIFLRAGELRRASD
jgi:hypothetical protein